MAHALATGPPRCRRFLLRLVENVLIAIANSPMPQQPGVRRFSPKAFTHPSM